MERSPWRRRCLVAGLAENLALFQLDPDAPGGWLAVLAVASRTKFVLLRLVSAAIATWRSNAGWRRWLALAHAPALPVAVAGCVAVAASPALTPAFAASWLAVIAWARGPSRAARFSPGRGSPAHRAAARSVTDAESAGTSTRRVARTAYASCKNSPWTQMTACTIVSRRCPASVGARRAVWTDTHRQCHAPISYPDARRITQS